MPEITDKQFSKIWWSNYCEKCKQCKNSCKQSWKVNVVCTKFEPITNI